MDDVERMYRHLVRTIRSTSPQMLTQPFQVADLYATILPYRLHRRDLGLETNQDYEMAMLEMLSGARGYLVVENRMREVLGASLKSPNPDPQLIREFASSRVSLSPEGLRQYDPDALSAATAAVADRARRRTGRRRGAGPRSSGGGHRRFGRSASRRGHATRGADGTAVERRLAVRALQGDAPCVETDHDRARRRKLPALQGRAPRRSADQLLPTLRSGSHGAALPRMRERAGARVEVLRHVRACGRRKLTVAAPRRPALSGLGASFAKPRGRRTLERGTT